MKRKGDIDSYFFVSFKKSKQDTDEAGEQERRAEAGDNYTMKVQK